MILSQDAKAPEKHLRGFPFSLPQPRTTFVIFLNKAGVAHTMYCADP